MSGHPAFPLAARGRAFVFVGALIVTGSLLNACAQGALPSIQATDAQPTAQAAITASEPASAAPGFLGGATPAPEATITPEQSSWDAVTVPAHLSIAVITADRDAGTLVLVDAVRAWADEHRVRVSVFDASSTETMAAALTDALAESPDLVIGVGASVVDVFAVETAQFLDQQFLVLGAQLAEPTENVTAVIWSGASFRGTGISEADADTDAAITSERARDAVAAGVASVLWHLTGIVIQLP